MNSVWFNIILVIGIYMGGLFILTKPNISISLKVLIFLASLCIGTGFILHPFGAIDRQSDLLTISDILRLLGFMFIFFIAIQKTFFYNKSKRVSKPINKQNHHE